VKCLIEFMANFENALVMSVDFLHPRAHQGRKHPHNLIACCRPCNMLKGRHIFKTFDEELRKSWESETSRSRGHAAKA